MDMQTTVVVLVLLLAIWWLMRKKRAASNGKFKSAMHSRKTKSPYHAVSISFSTDACNAARAMAGRRFLATAPPKLPLPGCDASECRCHFAHHDDRRSGQERRSPFAPGRGATGTGTYKQDQREGRDRRGDD
ncbi:MAG: hypothetical protein OEO82_02330 [Gammaproteobacteria bacterium]|nr:hypothetical protein [Gammaproteobacteria bacterium]